MDTENGIIINQDEVAAMHVSPSAFEHLYPFLTVPEVTMLSNCLEGADAAKAVFHMLQTWQREWLGAGFRSKRRTMYRAKLLNVAGLCRLFPLERIRGQVLQLHDLLANDSNPSIVDVYRSSVELPISQLHLVTPLVDALSATYRQGSCSYLEHITNSDDSFVRYVVFKPQLNDETTDTVSATSEPLTGTVVVRTTLLNDVSCQRDSISIAYDLVMQHEFLRIYNTSIGILDDQYVQLSMRLVGIEYAVAVFTRLYEHALDQGLLVSHRKGSQLWFCPQASRKAEAFAQHLAYVVNGLIVNPIQQILETTFENNELRTRIHKLLSPISLGVLYGVNHCSMRSALH